jgi:hypothetical protein
MEDLRENTIEENWELLKDTSHYDHEAIIRFYKIIRMAEAFLT